MSTNQLHEPGTGVPVSAVPSKKKRYTVIALVIGIFVLGLGAAIGYALSGGGTTAPAPTPSLWVPQLAMPDDDFVKRYHDAYDYALTVNSKPIELPGLYQDSPSGDIYMAWMAIWSFACTKGIPAQASAPAVMVEPTARDTVFDLWSKCGTVTNGSWADRYPLGPNDRTITFEISFANGSRGVYDVKFIWGSHGVGDWLATSAWKHE
jgi:hypothetical protein